MKEFLRASVYLPLLICIGSYVLGLLLRKKVKSDLLNPMLFSIIFCILFLVLTDTDYDKFASGTLPLSFLLTPATVCLAIPLYRQWSILKKNFFAIIIAVFSGVLASALTVFPLSWAFGITHEQYVTLLPKSITTAIGIGISQELGGIPTVTVVSIIATGILGNLFAKTLSKILRIKEPIAKGLAIGTSSHALGTTKAIEMGEIEGATSSLAIVLAGLLTVIVAPFAAMLL